MDRGNAGTGSQDRGQPVKQGMRERLYDVLDDLCWVMDQDKWSAPVRTRLETAIETVYQLLGIL